MKKYILSLSILVIFSALVSSCKKEEVPAVNKVPVYNSNKKFTVSEVNKMISHYQQNAQKNIKGSLLPDLVDFNLTTIQSITSNSNVKGIRAYFVEDENGVVKLLLMGYDAKGNNVLPTKTTTPESKLLNAKATEEGVIDDPTKVCPPVCN